MTRVFLAVSLVLASGCSNYRFARGAHGTVDVIHLLEVLENRQDERRLIEVLWIPLLYREETVFERTRNASFRQDGYTLYETWGVGPLSLFWSEERVVHHDAGGERYHAASEAGFGYRLAAASSHWVRGEDESFEYRRGEVLFGLLRSEEQGFTASVPFTGSAPSPRARPPPRHPDR